jgi:hypothetical protein
MRGKVGSKLLQASGTDTSDGNKRVTPLKLLQLVLHHRFSFPTKNQANETPEILEENLTWLFGDPYNPVRSLMCELISHIPGHTFDKLSVSFSKKSMTDSQNLTLFVIAESRTHSKYYISSGDGNFSV